jgi:hypothetical protein
MNALSARHRSIRASAASVSATGDTSPELLKMAHEAGLVILHKPLQPRVLLRLVKHLRR